MADNKKVCKNCGQENEPEYLYCINCGSDLDAPEFSGSAEYTPPPHFNMGGNYYNAAYKPFVDYSQVEPTINEVDTKKIQEYVGDKKRNFFLQAFITIKRTGRKMFFNWPVVLLGILVGLPFTASWFYYRKMYKVGLIISLCIFLLTACSVAVNYSTNLSFAQDFFEMVKEADMSELQALLQTTFDAPEISKTTSILNNIIDIVACGGVASVAAYSNYIYLKDITKKIKNSDQKIGTQNPSYYGGLGGTSIAAAIVIPILFSLLSTIVAMVPYIVALIHTI